MNTDEGKSQGIGLGLKIRIVCTTEYLVGACGTLCTSREHVVGVAHVIQHVVHYAVHGSRVTCCFYSMCRYTSTHV